jgi:L-ascorbate metabolism protein UlaG (beta-lactamase superfamily)
MTIELTWLGHSTVVLDVDGTRLLTDPLLRRHVGLLRRRGRPPSRDQWSNTDVVLLSHLHHDHADLRSMRLLPGGIPVITSPENVDWLHRHHLNGVSPGTDRWIHPRPGSELSVRLTLAVHHSRPMPHRPNGATGHLVRSSSGTVWFAGDTSLVPEMAAIPEQAGAPVDLAFVPISGWGPRLSGGHMGPAEAAEACRMVGARRVVPVHWGTLHTPGGRNLPRGWMDRPAAVFAEEMSKRAPDCRVVIPRIGDRCRLPVPG